jgi:hypothetical protein
MIKHIQTEFSPYGSSVLEWLNQQDISTGGANDKHIITHEVLEDGDIYSIIEIPVWWQNSHVLNGIVTLLDNFRKTYSFEMSTMNVKRKSGDLFGYIVLIIYHHCCNPD